MVFLYLSYQLLYQLNQQFILLNFNQINLLSILHAIKCLVFNQLIKMAFLIHCINPLIILLLL